ncbi:mitotic-spindle organizing protein 2 isoform X1 [Gouania willdenowi]|uniref:Mitotic-spindle organizing protein 2-like n=1 Tax=Gouania willdenowi TaxID=441366 RepID=A0A8C5FZS2_GOUWI|nr:mitotic-spindle organizing protein 2-like isoform X1 [Gouania willdenowi]
MSQTPSQTVCSSATDPQTVVVTANVQKYALKKKKVLNAEETELFELSQAAGITLDQEVFKIMVDLLKMNVAPQAVFQTLKSMCASQRAAEGGALDASSSSHTTSAPSAPAAAPTESREEDSLVSAKSSKPPVAPPPASGQRAPTRLNAKAVAYGPQDSQVRSKPSTNLGEKTRETSSQRVQRQPSASRGQKTKSSGSSSSSSQINST